MPNERLIGNTFMAEKKAWLPWFKRQAQKHGEEGTFPGFWKEIHKDLKELAPVPESITAVRFLELLSATEKHYEQAAELASLPYHQFVVRHKDFAKKVQASGNCFTMAMLPAIHRARYYEMELETRWAMLSAAITVKVDGIGALSTVKDPYDNRPFEYKEVDGGFELKSGLTRDDKPATLTFGISEKVQP